MNLKWPLNLKQTYALHCLTKNYNELHKWFNNSKSITRNKSYIIPKNTLVVGSKSQKDTAIKIFNKFPNNPKSLDNKNNTKLLKNWIQSNAKWIKLNV